MANKKVSHEEVFADDIFGIVDAAGKAFNNTVKEIRSNLQSLAKTEVGKIKLGDPKSLGDVETTRKATKAIDDYAKANEKLNKVQTDGAKIISILNERTRKLAEQNRDEAKLQGLSSDSLAAKRIELKNLITAYDALSEAQRKNVFTGGDLLKRIQGLDVEVKKLEATTGRHQRSVGNYEKGFRGLEKGLLAVEKITGISTDTLREGIKTFSDLVKGLHATSMASKDATASTEGLTIAQRIWNAVQSLSVPLIGVLVGAIGALVLIGIEYKDQIFGLTEAEKLRQTAMDGTIIKDDELREAHNKSIIKLRDLSIEYKVLTGTLTEYEGALLKIRNATSDKLNDIKKETKIKLEETTGFWKSFGDFLKSGGSLSSMTAKQTKEQLEIIKSGLIAQKDAVKENNAEELNERQKNWNEWDKWLADALKEIQEKKDEDAKKALEKLKEQLDLELKARQKMSRDAYDESKEADKIMEDTDKKIAEQNKKNLEDKSKALNHWYEEKKKLDAEAKKEEEKSEKEHEANLQKLREKRVESYAKMTEAIFQGLEEANKKELDANQTQLSELDSQIQYQQQLALQGETNTLAALEKERAEALAERRRLEEKARKEREAEQLAEVFLEFMKVYAKDGFRASAEATAQTLIAKGVSKIIAGSLYEGQEDIGKSTTPLDSKGGRLYMLHDNESVVTGEGTAQTPGLVTAVNEKGFLGAQEWAMKNIPLLEDKSKSEQVTEKLASMLVSQITGLRKDIQDLPDTDFKRNIIGEIVRIDREKGRTTETTFKNISPTYSKH